VENASAVREEVLSSGVVSDPGEDEDLWQTDGVRRRAGVFFRLDLVVVPDVRTVVGNIEVRPVPAAWELEGHLQLLAALRRKEIIQSGAISIWTISRLDAFCFSFSALVEDVSIFPVRSTLRAGMDNHFEAIWESPCLPGLPNIIAAMMPDWSDEVFLLCRIEPIDRWVPV